MNRLAGDGGKMPLYEYTCRKCEHTFEVLGPAKDQPEIRCPACDGGEVDRLIGLPAAGPTPRGKPVTNCRGDGPSCGVPWCGRNL